MFFYFFFIRPTEDTSDSKVKVLPFFLFIRPTEDTSDSKLNYFLFVIYQADRRHFRLEMKCSSTCHLSGRQKTLPTRNEMFFHLSFIRPTEDTSDSKLNVLLFVIYQTDRRHFRHEIKCSFICHLSGRQKTLPTPNEMNSSICHLSGRQKTLPTRNKIIFYLSFIRPTEDTSDSKINYILFVIHQADGRHFLLESECSSICHLSGRQKTLPIRN